eukprot:CAMPEP_0184484934 /NCGR_PEP_ID=MMETSP0113_2-20130426/6598_1 /TAXON_ID=91329 /ORGANISM="Norrisiella sphaerica, Strain BC52" /LENGTH=393 /DNA_ID=CAMNT_0026866159 /DNA_START=37 /DNA_END=1218 /DNA_ORIENTATION=+
MISRVKSEKSVKDFASMNYKDLWQWDRDSSGSGPDDMDKSSVKSTKNGEEMKDQSRAPPASQNSQHNTLSSIRKASEHSFNDKLTKDGNFSDFSSESAGGLSMNLTPNRTPSKSGNVDTDRDTAQVTRTFRPKCFSTQEWNDITRRLRRDLRYGEWAYHSKSKKMWWSPSLYKIFNVQPSSERVPKLLDMESLVHKEDRELLQFLFDRAIQDGINFSVTHRCTVPDSKDRSKKKTIWCHCICRVYSSLDGTPTEADASLSSQSNASQGKRKATDGFNGENNSSIQSDGRKVAKFSLHGDTSRKEKPLQGDVSFDRSLFSKMLQSDNSESSASSEEDKAAVYLAGVVQDVTSTINDSNATDNFKCFINDREAQLSHSPLDADEILNANPVCQLS